MSVAEWFVLTVALAGVCVVAAGLRHLWSWPGAERVAMRAVVVVLCLCVGALVVVG